MDAASLVAGCKKVQKKGFITYHFTIKETIMNNLMTKSLAQIVNSNHRAANVFEKYHLDFCCKGKEALKKPVLKRNYKLKKCLPTWKKKHLPMILPLPLAMIQCHLVNYQNIL